MEGWLEAFVVVATAAIVIQMAILVATHLQFRQMTRIAFDLQTKIDPVLAPVAVVGSRMLSAFRERAIGG